eukprot:37175-Chlamydomonas_euryale.AAC.1
MQERDQTTVEHSACTNATKQLWNIMHTPTRRNATKQQWNIPGGNLPNRRWMHLDQGVLDPLLHTLVTP